MSLTTACLVASARDAGRELGAGSTLVFQALGPDRAGGAPDEDVQTAIVDGDPADIVREHDGALDAASGSSSHRARSPKRGGSVLVTQSKVLELARASAVPSGHPVERRGARPSGIELSGVTGLGIGLIDGDVLTDVAGSPVRSEGRIVGIVVRALARHDARISATFWRAGSPWTLVVELPRVTLPADLQPR